MPTLDVRDNITYQIAQRQNIFFQYFPTRGSDIKLVNNKTYPD